MPYHKRKIQKEKIGTIEKIYEEFQELKDAYEQENKILILNELSDIVGALKIYVEILNIDMCNKLFCNLILNNKKNKISTKVYNNKESYNVFFKNNIYLFSDDYFQEIKNSEDIDKCLMIIEIYYFIEYVLDNIFKNVITMIDVSNMACLTIECFKDGTRK